MAASGLVDTTKRAISAVAALLFAALSLAPARAQSVESKPAEARVVVVGEGSVTVAPDYARIRSGVSTNARTVKEASDTNSKLMANIIAALADAGIAKKDIQTSEFSIEPVYASATPPGGPKLSGYRVSNQVNVTIHQISQVSEVLDRLVKAGATDAGNIAFLISDREKALDQAREAAIANVKRLCDLRDASSHKPVVHAAISMALGCSISGAVDPKEVLRLVEKCLEAGVDAVGIADTVGYAGPKQVGDLTKAAVGLAGKTPICVHLHDTRGMGIANASAALDEGARILDGSLGGLGGSPFAPGATGNVVFEDLVFLCESKGFVTGIDIDRLIAVRAILRESMPNEPLYGGLARAGLPCATPAKAA